MNTQRNRFIRWQMRRWKRKGMKVSRNDAMEIWVTYQWLGMHY